MRFGYVVQVWSLVAGSPAINLHYNDADRASAVHEFIVSRKTQSFGTSEPVERFTMTDDAGLACSFRTDAISTVILYNKETFEANHREIRAYDTITQYINEESRKLAELYAKEQSGGLSAFGFPSVALKEGA